VNRNTAAVYFGSCALIWLLILCNHIRRQLPSDPREWRGVLRHIVFDLSFRPIFSFAMMLLCIAAMLMTNSRAGIVLSLLSLVVAFAAFFYRDLPRKGGLVTTLGLGALFALGIVYLLGGRVSGRFDVQGLSDEGRLDVYRSTWRMISDHPWFGTGLGTFVWSFPAYRTSNIPVWGIWDRAHSTPLELAADLGIPLASLVVLSWVIALAVLARGVATRRRDRIVPSAAFAVALLASTHSLLDFSLQIPGYAVIVFSLLGAGLAQSFSNIRTNSGDS
jgi:O-antigen ligase